jgi:hypothetical protein
MPRRQRLRVGGSRLVARLIEVRGCRFGPRCEVYRHAFEFENLADLVWLFFAARCATKMEHLALSVFRRRCLIALQFRFDRGYQRRYWNWLLAVKTSDATIGLVGCDMRHSKPRLYR